MPHRVACIVDTALYRLIAYVHSVATGLRQVGLVVYLTVVPLAVGGLCHACRAGLERVFTVLVASCVEGKSALAGGDPWLAQSRFHVVNQRGVVVVVDDDLMSLPVAFAWRVDNGTCVLEHGNEIRHDDGLGEQVFVSAEQGRALPPPLLFVLVVVAAVAGPKCQVAVFQSTGYLVGTRHILYPRLAVVLDVIPGLCFRLQAQADKQPSGEEQPIHCQS